MQTANIQSLRAKMALGGSGGNTATRMLVAKSMTLECGLGGCWTLRPARSCCGQNLDDI
jgi:hypothetical protein